MSVDAYHRTCYDCGVEDTRPLAKVPIHEDLPSGGYERIEVPLCRRCRGKRFGFECSTCGILHDSHEEARYCCERRPGEAPDCPACGRRMARGAWGVTAKGRQTVEWAECEPCDIQWGRFTGWHGVDDGDAAGGSDE